MGVSRVFEVNNTGVSRVLGGSHKGVKGRYTAISRVLQGCYKSYKGITMVILGFYKGVVWVFHLCCHNPNSTTM